MKGFNRHDIRRDACMLTRGQARQGYDWWWHSFTAYDEKGDPQPFFLEFFVCNPASGGEKPVFGQLPQNKAGHVKPSYLMVKAGAWGENAVQVHRFFGWKEIDLRFQAPFSVAAGDCFLNETETRGRVSVTPEEAAAHPEYLCGSGEIRWDLRIRKVTAYQVGYGAGR